MKKWIVIGGVALAMLLGGCAQDRAAPKVAARTDSAPEQPSAPRQVDVPTSTSVPEPEPDPSPASVEPSPAAVVPVDPPRNLAPDFDPAVECEEHALHGLCPDGGPLVSGGESGGPNDCLVNPADPRCPRGEEIERPTYVEICGPAASMGCVSSQAACDFMNGEITLAEMRALEAAGDPSTRTPGDCVVTP